MQIFGIPRSEKKEKGIWYKLEWKYKLMVEKGEMRLNMPQSVPFTISSYCLAHQKPLHKVIFVEKRKMIWMEYWHDLMIWTLSCHKDKRTGSLCSSSPWPWDNSTPNRIIQHQHQCLHGSKNHNFENKKRIWAPRNDNEMNDTYRCNSNALKVIPLLAYVAANHVGLVWCPADAVDSHLGFRNTTVLWHWIQS